MPVRFTCSACNQLLSVGRRKIGATVACPKCHTRIIVPSEEGAAVEVGVEPSTAAVELPHASEAAIGLPHGAPPDNPFDFEHYDDVPRVVVVPSGGPRSDTTASQDDTLVAISRYVLYAQAVLIAAVAIVGFGLGYLAGRAAPPPAAKNPPVQQP